MKTIEICGEVWSVYPKGIIFVRVDEDELHALDGEVGDRVVLKVLGREQALVPQEPDPTPVVAPEQARAITRVQCPYCSKDVTATPRLKADGESDVVNGLQLWETSEHACGRVTRRVSFRMSAQSPNGLPAAAAPR